MSNSNKNTIYVEANIINIYAKFQLHPPYGVWEEDFWMFLSPRKFSLSVAMATSQSQRNLDKIHMVGSGLHYRNMYIETLNCQSNESTWATTIKKIQFMYRLMSWTFLQSFSFIPLVASEKKDFLIFFPENLAFRLPWQPTIKISDFDKIRMVGSGLLQEHFCKTFVKISAVTRK